MALVLNRLDHRVALTYGYIGGRETGVVDLTLPLEAQLRTDGVLVVVDPSVEPVAPDWRAAVKQYIQSDEPPQAPYSWIKLDADGVPTGEFVVDDGENVTTFPLSDDFSPTFGYINANAAPYNAIPGSGVDQHDALQGALDAAKANYLAGAGTTVVELNNAGTYTFALHEVPSATSWTYAAMFWLHPGVMLRLGAGVTLKLEDAATFPESPTVPIHYGAGITVSDPNNSTAGIKKHVAIFGNGATLDLNGNNQITTYTDGTGNFNGYLWRGVFLNLCDAPIVDRLRVVNVYGTASGPPGESYHFSIERSRNPLTSFCISDGSGATDTASGFTEGWNEGAQFIGCTAHDMSHGQGFVSYRCSNTRYVSCRGYSISAQAAFQEEDSHGLFYSNCHAGGQSFEESNVNLQVPGLTNHSLTPCNIGWKLMGGSHITIDDSCTALYCTTNGLRVMVHPSSGYYPNEIHARGEFLHTQTPAGTATGEDTTFSTVANRNNTNIDSTLFARPTGTGDFTLGSDQLTNVVGTFHPGQYIIPTNAKVPPGTRVLSISGSTITMTAPATLGGTTDAIAMYCNVMVDGKTNREASVYRSVMGRGPVHETVDLNGSDGHMWVVTGSANHAFRWIRGNTNGTPDLEVDGVGRVVTRGRKRALRVITANAGVAKTDDILLATTSGITITLPTIVTADAGTSYTVLNRTGGNVTVARNGAASIDGTAADLTLATGTKATLVTDGAVWYTT